MLKIETEKIVVRGVSRRKIIAISGTMAHDEIPEAYFNQKPYFDAIPQGLHLYAEGEFFGTRLVEGSDFSESEFQNLLSIIHMAGKRLHELREDEKKLKKIWNGKETFCI